MFYMQLFHKFTRMLLVFIFLTNWINTYGKTKENNDSELLFDKDDDVLNFTFGESCEFNLSTGIGFNSYSTELNNVNCCISKSTGELFLEDIDLQEHFFKFHPFCSKIIKFYPGTIRYNIGHTSAKYDPIYEYNGRGMIRLNNILVDMNGYGLYIPIKLSFDFVICRIFKIGFGTGMNFNYIFNLYSSNISKKIMNNVSETNFAKRYTKNFNKELAHNFRMFNEHTVFGLISCRLFEKDFYSLWINHKSGILWNYGKNLVFSKYIYKGYFGSIGLVLQKYFSTNKKIFFGLNTYFSPNFKDEDPLNNKISKVRLEQNVWKFLELEIGVTLGGNDGYYSRTKEKLDRDDYYMKKYNRTFEYYDEYKKVNKSKK